jgi:putative transposase
LPAVEPTRARPLPTIWEVPDDLWEEIEPIIGCFYPPARTGRPRADLRRVLDGIIFRLRSGCQWEQLPERYGPSSTVHGWFQRFSADGFLEELWAYLVRECDELGEVHWEWQAVDGVMGKSRHGGWARRLAVALARRLEVAPLRVGWCVWLIFSD